MIYMVTLTVPDEKFSGTLDVVVYNPLAPDVTVLYEDRADAERLMAYMQNSYPDELYKIQELEITPATPSPTL